MPESLQFRLVPYRKIYPDVYGDDPHFLVYCGDVQCGVIIQHREHPQRHWQWAVHGFVFRDEGKRAVLPVSATGMAETRESAMASWREAWERLQPDLAATKVANEWDT